MYSMSSFRGAAAHRYACRSSTWRGGKGRERGLGENTRERPLAKQESSRVVVGSAKHKEHFVDKQRTQFPESPAAKL